MARRDDASPCPRKLINMPFKAPTSPSPTLAGQSPSSPLAPTTDALALLAPWACAGSLPPAQMTSPSTVSPEGQFDFLRVPPPLPLLPTPRHPAWHEEALQASQ